MSSVSERRLRRTPRFERDLALYRAEAPTLEVALRGIELWLRRCPELGNAVPGRKLYQRPVDPPGTESSFAVWYSFDDHEVLLHALQRVIRSPGHYWS
jgi:hypothetical protein